MSIPAFLAKATGNCSNASAYALITNCSLSVNLFAYFLKALDAAISAAPPPGSALSSCLVFITAPIASLIACSSWSVMCFVLPLIMMFKTPAYLQSSMNMYSLSSNTSLSYTWPASPRSSLVSSLISFTMFAPVALDNLSRSPAFTLFAVSIPAFVR